MLGGVLNFEGVGMGRRHVWALMKAMCIDAIYRRANTSWCGQAKWIYPYLLRSVIIDHPNRVWAMGTICLPMRRGFVYLCVLRDWATRKRPPFTIRTTFG